MRRHACPAAFCLIVLLARVAAAAQTASATSGSIAGMVTDSTGAAVFGVLVTLSGEALMGRRTAATDREGRYQLPALPPGEYQLTFAVDLFSPVRRDGVRVALGFTTTVDVELSPATQSERVTVHGHANVLDRSSAATIRTFNADDLGGLPNSRSLVSLLGATPALEVSNIDAGSGIGTNPGAYGAYGTRGFNRPMIEGIVVTGIFSTAFTPDYGSFEEAAVLTASHGPEWPNPGAHIQIITKSGGNKYRGTLYTDYENRNWQSFNVDHDQVARGAQSGGGLSPREANRLWHESDVNADIGGFVIRDRLWWYASGRRQGLSIRLVDFPVRPQSTQIANVTGKITYGFATNHRLTAFVQAARNHQPNRLDPFGPVGSRVTGTTAINPSEDSTADQHAVGWVWKGEWNGAIRDRLLFELRGAEFGADQRWTPRTAAPRVEDIATLVVRGGNRDSEEGLRRDQVLGALNYFSGALSGPSGHHLKVGFEAIRSIDSDSWLVGYPDNVLHVVRAGNPTEVYLFEAPTRSLNGLWAYSVYASDTWRPFARLTLDAGVRFDRYRLFLPSQEHPWGGQTQSASPPFPTSSTGTSRYPGWAPCSISVTARRF